MLVWRFPVLSETFIARQIAGLLRRSVQVDIYLMDAPGPEDFSSPLVDEVRRGAAIISRPLMPEHWLPRCLKAAGLVAANLGCCREIVSSLNLWRYPYQAGSLKLLFGALRFRHRPRYDIIHCHYGPVGLHGLALRELGRVSGRLIVSFHGYDASRFVRRWGSRMYRPLLAGADQLLAVSEGLKRRLVAWGTPPDRVALHRCGVDCQLLSFASRSPPVEGPIRLLSVGRLVEKKGFQHAIQAVAELGARHRLEYRIVGGGPERDRLAEQIARLGVGSRVHLLGPLAHARVLELYRDSHLLLAPSLTARDGDAEGIPVVLMEAMATGLPVLATDHGGIPELVCHAESGYLVPEREVGHLATGLRALLERPESWAGMGLTGRRRVEAEFNADSWDDRLVERYRQVLGGPPGAR